MYTAMLTCHILNESYLKKTSSANTQKCRHSAGWMDAALNKYDCGSKERGREGVIRWDRFVICDCGLSLLQCLTYFRIEFYTLQFPQTKYLS